MGCWTDKGAGSTMNRMYRGIDGQTHCDGDIASTERKELPHVDAEIAAPHPVNQGHPT